MPLYDYECPVHGEFEEVASQRDATFPCRKCGRASKRLIGVSRVNMYGDSAKWVREMIPVLDDPHGGPAIKEFVSNPTRENLKKAMKSKGLRHFEPGEKRQKPTFDTKRHTDLLAKEMAKDNRIEVSPNA